MINQQDKSNTVNHSSQNGEKIDVNIPNFLSPEMQKVLANWTPYWEEEGFEGLPEPGDYEGWKRNNEAKKVVALAVGQSVVEEFGANVEERYLRDVRTLDIKPKDWKNKDSVLVHTHGGGHYAHSPDSALILSIPLADFLGIRIVSVDYRLMPAENWTVLDQRNQVIDVYKTLIEDEGFKNLKIGAIGCSSGGTLTMQFVNKLSHDKYPVPGAAVLQAPMTDFTFSSDTHNTFKGIDPVVDIELFKKHTFAMLGITNKQALDPEYSPVFDDYKDRDFPPILLQVGTKETMLGDSVRMYDRLKQDGVEVAIDPHEVMIHCFHSHYKTPEARLAVRRVSDWFTKHLKLKE